MALRVLFIFVLLTLCTPSLVNRTFPAENYEDNCEFFASATVDVAGFLLTPTGAHGWLWAAVTIATFG